jgi:hypothetical protein
MALTRLFLVLRFCYEEAYILVHLKSDCKMSIFGMFVVKISEVGCSLQVAKALI